MKNEENKTTERHGVLIRSFFLPPCSSVVKIFLLFILCTANLFGQVASRTDGVNVFYYDSLHEALSAVADTAAVNRISIEQPDEITLLVDLVPDEPLIVDEGVHIRLVAEGNRTIRRSPNLIEFPVFWVRGEGSSLSLGKPGMEYELILDGGRLNSPPIEAHAPLIALNGSGSKLIMYDKVTLQNNINNGTVPTYASHQNGAGVYISAYVDNRDRYPEFIMKGGYIRGNINNTQNVLDSGGGVMIFYTGIFTMEGGFLMNNTANTNGGGFSIYGPGLFKKTGGIIYGSDAPAEYRNTAINGIGSPKTYGHAVAVNPVGDRSWGYRDDTVGENDNLSYPGLQGEKWDTPDKAFLRRLLAIILPILAAGVCVFLILWKITLQKRKKMAQEAAENVRPKIDLENSGLTNREKEICELLLTNSNLKEIATILGVTYAGANFHAKNLYAKLGIKNRTELLVRVKSETLPQRS
jgi:DNA-binding CsgD family transcriptional regulator